MKRISIIRGGEITNQVEMEATEAAAWLERHLSMGTFGKQAYSYDQETSPAVIDGNGNIVTPAVVEKIHVPAEFEVQEEDVTTEVVTRNLKNQRIKDGKAARAVCEDVLDLVAGFNLDRELTAQQITSMQSALSQIEMALRASRPKTAKSLISAMAPDGVLVTQEMKDLCLQLLADY
jgi:hypothetical protein